MQDEKLWNGIATASAVTAVIAAKPVVEKIWRAAFRSDPPGNPAATEVQWRDATFLRGLTRLPVEF